MSAAVDPRTPCLIGVAQRTWRPGGDPAPEPLAMWGDVCRSAATDAGAVGGAGAVLSAAQSLQVVHCLSWPYDDPVGRLADQLGIDPVHRHYSGIGGTTTQRLVQGAAAQMLNGELDVAVISGGEALATKRRLSRQGEKPAWSHRDPVRRPFPFEAPFHPAEVAHEVFQAWLTFALFDVARRGHLGVAPDDYRQAIGAVLAPMTVVAASNPHAWFPEELSIDELVTATPANRIVGYPYTKRMVSVMDVDMAAAVVVATEGAADDLGVPRDRRVYLRGWGWATDPDYVAEHARLWESPAMREASRAALGAAGLGVDDIAHFDLYSCFGSSLHLAIDALGLDPSDPRGVTVTGGLPFAGGPANNYLGHALASMVGALRADAGSFGLVSGVGMHMTKHTFAAYSTTPGPVAPPDDAAVQRAVEAAALPVSITDTATGSASIATYSVVHDRDGSRAWGLVIADLDDGSRCYARVDDPVLLEDMERSEWVGSTVALEADGQVNRVVGT